MWLDNPLINNSEIARALNISPDLFYKKKKNIQRNRFTEEEIKRLDKIRKQLREDLK